ncbi:MAG: hypothetical protein GF416_04135 [Candidatus Altiarchaeales archaeon]|nr:hypothetical protein [Candidatus Altiarchaeales archaeon]MBD3416309.1 hypothetical protein [Candidatus Altiarchaeales archaeon]
MKKFRTLFVVALALLMVASFVSAQASGAESARDVICTVLSNIKWLLVAIAGGVGVVVVALQGIKWIGSAEDPGARKQAKQGIIHAVVGIVIVLAAVWLVALVISNAQGCGGIYANP